MAIVSLRDPRIAACFEAFLRSAGFDVHRGQSGGLPSCAVLVVESSASAAEQIRRRLERNRACRVIVFGARKPEWEQLGATVIERRGGLTAIRNVLSRVTAAPGE